MSEKTEKDSLVAEAKALGVKSPHLMGMEKLKDAIAKAKAEAAEKASGAGTLGDGAAVDKAAADKAAADKAAVDKATADSDCWLYHETEYPRIFRAGQAVPEGWSNENRKLWSFDDFGAWRLV